MLEVQHISRRFGNVAALRDVSFSVRRGEVLGLVGPNGAGKTTLLEILSGLLPAEAGSPFLGYRPPLSPGRRKQVMFYVPEGITPYPEVRAGRLLTLFAALFGREDDVLASTIAALHLTPVLDTRIGVSKGYRRRPFLHLGFSRRSR